MVGVSTCLAAFVTARKQLSECRQSSAIFKQPGHLCVGWVNVESVRIGKEGTKILQGLSIWTRKAWASRLAFLWHIKKTESSIRSAIGSVNNILWKLVVRLTCIYEVLAPTVDAATWICNCIELEWVSSFDQNRSQAWCKGWNEWISPELCTGTL